MNSIEFILMTIFFSWTKFKIKTSSTFFSSKKYFFVKEIKAKIKIFHFFLFRP